MEQFRFTFGVRVAVLIGLAMTLMPGARTAGQTPDPFVGTWKVNIAKSRFIPGPPPKSSTARIELAGEGIKVTSDNVGPDGQTTRLEYVASNDGKDYPVQGALSIDAMSARRIDVRTVDLEYKKGGKTVRTLRARVSADGKTMTVTVKGTNAQGQAVGDNVFYEKQ